MSATIAVIASALLAAQSGSLEAAAQAFDDAQLHHDRGAISGFLAQIFNT